MSFSLIITLLIALIPFTLTQFNGALKADAAIGMTISLKTSAADSTTYLRIESTVQDVWYGIGFNSSVMLDTNAISIEVDQTDPDNHVITIDEWLLPDDTTPSNTLTVQWTNDLYSYEDGYTKFEFSRANDAGGGNYYTFSESDDTLDVIIAHGTSNADTIGYHGTNRIAITLTATTTSDAPTDDPSSSPTTDEPTDDPSTSPTTDEPTSSPTGEPSTSPTGDPSGSPTVTRAPTGSPVTDDPTTSPITGDPTTSPITRDPTGSPTGDPTGSPITGDPTGSPITGDPTGSPITGDPTTSPITDDPTTSPISEPPTTSPTFSIDSFETLVANIYLDEEQTVSIMIGVDYEEEQMLIVLNGPGDVWFGVGFGSDVMESTYAVIVEGEDGILTERILGNHAAGDLLDASDNDQYILNDDDGSRWLYMVRDWYIDDVSFNFEPFVMCEYTELNVIYAVGSEYSFAYHARKGNTNADGDDLKINSIVEVCESLNKPTTTQDVTTTPPIGTTETVVLANSNRFVYVVSVICGLVTVWLM